MRRKLLKVAALVLTFFSGLSASAVDQVDGVYQIGTPQDLIDFAEIVNSGIPAVDAVLLNDIDLRDLSYMPPIGTQHYPASLGPMLSYGGTFDGQGHIIYNLTIDREDIGAEYGLFGRLQGATIKNLGIVNATFRNPSALRAGVLCGACTYSSRITNCFTAGDINMSECVCQYNSKYGDGLCGLINSESIVSNCYTTYNTIGDPDMGAGTILNSYAGEDALARAASGELCFLLNGDQSEITWYQTLGEDVYPILDSTHKTVYGTGDLRCDGKTVGEATFSNEGSTILPDHQYENHTCTVCGQIDMKVVPQDAEGWYEISNADQYAAYALYVSNGYNHTNARLMADIDLTESGYVPISSSTSPYYGTFDGQGHSITIAFDRTNTAVSLFRYLYGTVENLIVKGSITISKQYAATISAHAYSGAKINNVVSLVDFTSTVEGDGTHGGIVAIVETSGVELNNCIFAGAMKGEHTTCCGGLIGWSNGTTLTNCVMAGDLSGIGKVDTYNFSRNPGNALLRNCYCIEPAEEVLINPGTILLNGTRGESMADGSLCFQLNGDQQNLVWYQNLGEDLCPVPFDTHKTVYGTGDLRCDGHILGEVTFSNNGPNGLPEHKYVDGTCIECGKNDPNAIDIVDGWYELHTAGQLLAFGKLVNDGQSNLNARLMEDIDLGDISYFPPIGTQYFPASLGPQLFYGGTFDGQGHIIYNLNIDNDDEGAETGLFGRLQGATIKNLGIVNATFKNFAALRAGVLCGACTYSSTITNCFAAGEINMVDCICQHNAANGDGLCGLINSESVVSNCYTTYATIGDPDMGAGTILNSYAGEDILEKAASGELCFALSGGNMIDPVWRQNVGEDEYPVLDATHGIVCQTLDNTYATINQSDFGTTRTAILTSDKAYLEEAIAAQSLLDAYKASLEELSQLNDQEAFLTAYTGMSAQKEAIHASENAYKTYQEKIDFLLSELEANPEMEGEARDILSNYLEEEGEPSETYTNGTYEYIISTRLLTNEELTEEMAQAQALYEEFLAKCYVAGTDITKLLKNADLKDSFNGWEGSLPNGSGSCSASPYVAAECWNATFDMYQTITELRNGIYMLTMNASTRPGSNLSQQGNIYSTNYSGALYLNDNYVYLPVASETYMPIEDAQDGVNCNLSYGSALDDAVSFYTEDGETLIGYGIHGTQSMAIAANAGRGEVCLLVNVTDGNLTVGIKNPGNGSAYNWTGFANIHLTYVGQMENASEQMSKVLENQIARANTLLAYNCSTGADYAEFPNFSQTLKDELSAEIADADKATTPEEQYAIIGRFSETFKNILTCKQNYIQMLSSAEKATSIADLASGDEHPYLTQEEVKVISDQVEKIWIGYTDGTFSSEEALAMIDKMNEVAHSFIEVVDGGYQIATPQQFGLFSVLVRQGETNANAVLTTDIDISSFGFVPVTPYYGTFDGQGHSILINFEGDEQYSLFPNLYGTVKNLIVKGSITTSGQFAAAITSHSYASTKINNVVSLIDIITSVEGDGTHGGIVGVVEANGTELTNCIFAGTMKGESTSNCGGLVGWSNGCTLTNCIMAGDITGIGTNDTYNFGRCSVNVHMTNCFYVEPVHGSVNGGTLLLGGREGVKNGELCFQLNGDQQEPTWFQTLGEDDCPVPFATHKTVYGAGDMRCDGRILGENVSFNNDGPNSFPDHHFVDDVCTVCGQFDTSIIEKDEEDGFYKIGNVNQWKLFATMVNSGKSDINGKLVADIEFPKNELPMIGDSESNKFNGIFDGQYHTISFNVNATEDRTAPFRHVSGTIRNLQTTGIIRTAYLYGCGVCAIMYGALVENCHSSVEINILVPGVDQCHSGVAGRGTGAGSQVINCLFDGKITGESPKSTSGILGWAASATLVKNCLQIADIEVGGDGSGCRNIAWGSSSNLTVENCYYTQEWGKKTSNSIQVTDEQLASGEVCYLLNGSMTPDENAAWTQTLGTDANPLPMPGHGLVDLVDGAYKNITSPGEGVNEILCRDQLVNGIFNLQGQKVNKTTKGVYIINGKKVLVK